VVPSTMSTTRFVETTLLKLIDFEHPAKTPSREATHIHGQGIGLSYQAVHYELPCVLVADELVHPNRPSVSNALSVSERREVQLRSAIDKAT
jgi:hypothetical protein